jgi:transcriptional regulator with XRE-family HTH domain
VDAGTVIREARLRHGLTQQQLATRARTSQAAISRIERGVVSPTVATVNELLDLVGEEGTLATRQTDHGVDVTLLHENLRLTPEERIRKQATFANRMRDFQRAVGVEPIDV